MSAPLGVLAIDAGQTGIKVRIHAASGVYDDVFPGIRTNEALLPQLAAVARTVMAKVDNGVSVIAAGVSGLTAREAVAATLRERIDGNISRVLLAHDSTTSFLGALGDTRGAVVAAGTGVVTLAVGRQHVARVDGWGHLVGDAGSGYWIGREAIDAVMRAYDGRGLSTDLREVVEQRWPNLAEAYIQLQAEDDRVSIVASLAEDVARLAADGEEVARDITRRAAVELALSVETALRRVSKDDREEDFEVCAIGGVFRSGTLRHEFARQLRGSSIPIELVEPRGHGVDGALALANLSPRHPLAADVSAVRE